MKLGKRGESEAPSAHIGLSEQRKEEEGDQISNWKQMQAYTSLTHGHQPKLSIFSGLFFYLGPDLTEHSPENFG